MMGAKEEISHEQIQLNPCGSAAEASGNTGIERRKIVAVLTVILLAISLPFVVVHLMAAPDDTSITPLQHGMAAAANFFGPWGVVVVRIVNFPNAGLRSFDWSLAAGLTLLGALLFFLPLRIRNRPMQILLIVLWGLFAVVWFGVGLVQIADGLL